jgi:hypothetical protein
MNGYVPRMMRFIGAENAREMAWASAAEIMK